LGLLEVGGLFATLAKAKACMQIFMSHCGPTWAYQKWGAHSQHWPMQRPMCKSWSTTGGQLKLIRNRQPIHNFGPFKGQYGNTCVFM
jgi:hypothetical protein